MIVREMKEEDLKNVCSMEQDIFGEPWSEEDFKDAMLNKNNLYLVAEDSETLAGYCGYWDIAGEGYIYNVAVKKEYRRQHIASLLLKELIRIGGSRETKAFTLEVRCSNHPAIELYQSLGFVSAGVRKDFYSKPKEDAYIMWLKSIQ